jgi:hypothetical protein
MKSILVAGALALATPALAATYSLDFSQIGLEGTIMTDGTQGALVPNDITNWNLTFHVPDWTRTDYDVTFTPANSYIGYPFGGDLTADAAGLHWNFSANDLNIFEMQPISSATCNCFFAFKTRYVDNPQVIAVNGPNFELSSVMPETNLIAASVPEPATWAMLLLGFAGLAVLQRNRRCIIRAPMQGV